MKKLNLKTIFALIVSCLMLTACVTEETGGFNVDASDERAVEDYLRLSMGYLAQNDVANTKRHLNNAMDIDSNNSTVYGIWGLVYSAEGDVGLADDSFRRSLRIDSDNSQVRNNYAAFLYANARYEDAFGQLEKVVEDTEYPSRSQAFENLGLAALQVDKVEDAEYAFGRALQLNSNQLQSRLELTDISLKKSNNSQARSYFAAYLTLAEFYNIAQTPRSLWLGVQIENASGDDVKAKGYGDTLQADFASSPENALYQQSLGNP